MTAVATRPLFAALIIARTNAFTVCKMVGYDNVRFLEAGHLWCTVLVPMECMDELRAARLIHTENKLDIAIPA